MKSLHVVRTLAALLFVSVGISPRLSAGDPPCPGSCPTECALISVDPTTSGSGCQVLTMTWTRKRDGCCSATGPCRTCSGRLLVTVSMDQSCYDAGNGGLSWTTYLQSGAGQPWNPTANGKGGATLDPNTGLYTYVDPHDMEAACGKAARYQINLDGAGSLSGSAEYACDGCSQ